MKHFFWYIIVFFQVFHLLTAEASVSPNPFLRPGSQQKPPAPVKTIASPKPVPQKDMSKEIEFRGYFVLKGKPFFCLFNKKSNHGEWVSLSENTYEEFEASEFDMQTEVLTVLYEGNRYELSLLQGGSSMGTTPRPLPTRSAPFPSSNNSTPSSTTKYMPPRPKTTPQLPEWLVNKRSNSLPLPFNRGTSAVNGFSGSSLPRRITPNLPSPLRQLPDVNPSSSSRNSPSTRFPSLNRDPSVQQNPVNTGISSPDSAISNISESSQSNDSTSSELDLDSLPPPPPPPNIVPPSPPPDIIPSREN